MVIVGILGGFGNQLSAYAWGYSLAKHLGQELVLDISDYTQKGYARPYCLDQLRIGAYRKLMYPPCSADFMDENSLPPSLRKGGLRIIKSTEAKTREQLLEMAEGAENIYLLGYGGFHYCTHEEQEELKEQFQLKKDSSALTAFREKICNEYSVAIHIRRTDFVELGDQTYDDFFRAAITYVHLFYPNAQFYFFSDDIQYAKEQFGACKDYHYVHFLGGMDADMEEFFSIAACNCRILSAKSSFSEWASVLSCSERRMDICMETEQGERIRGSKIYLNEYSISVLNRLYGPELIPNARKSMPADLRDKLANFVSDGHNDEAIGFIDQISMDGYMLSSEDMQELESMKAIAQAQKGGNLTSPLLSFYHQMQWANADADFHANFLLTLYNAGHTLESAIHAALANRCGDGEEYDSFFLDGTQEKAEALELYHLIRDTQPKQFVFFPIEDWSYFPTYVKSLAVLLARMGQEVLFVRHQREATVPNEASGKHFVEAAFNFAEELDSIYKYHIKRILVPFKEQNGDMFPLYRELLSQCAAQSNRKTVAVTSQPYMFSEPRVHNVLYMVPDIADPLNRERYALSEELDNYVAIMAKGADVLFLSGTKFEKYSAQFVGTIREAFPAWSDGEYVLAEENISFTPNYIASDNMIRNAAAMLRCAAQIANNQLDKERGICAL